MRDGWAATESVSQSGRQQTRAWEGRCQPISLPVSQSRRKSNTAMVGCLRRSAWCLGGDDVGPSVCVSVRVIVVTRWEGSGG